MGRDRGRSRPDAGIADLGTNLEDVDIPRFTRGIAQILRKHLLR
jgi:hypothetical protein